MILYLSYKNLDQSIYSTSLLIPISQDKIQFVHDFQIKSLNFYEEKGSILYLNNLTTDITNFLDNLTETDNY
jgi:hypothetical protein